MRTVPGVSPASERDSQDLAQEAWRLLTEIFRERKEQFPEIAGSLGLNPGALHALMSLDPDEPHSMSTLAHAWKCDASNVTWLVDRLEEGGYAERRAHPTDRRVRTVAMTREGAKARARVERILHEPPAAVRSLSERDLQTLVRLLHKIAPTA